MEGGSQFESGRVHFPRSEGHAERERHVNPIHAPWARFGIDVREGLMSTSQTRVRVSPGPLEKAPSLPVGAFSLESSSYCGTSAAHNKEADNNAYHSENDCMWYKKEVNSSDN